MTNKQAIHNSKHSTNNSPLATHNSPLINFAFTLAETLIVMGIIGVVAALTLPNLNSSTGEKEKVIKLQKIYSNLSDAVGRASAIYGPPDEWPLFGPVGTGERLIDFFKTSKVCGYPAGNCFANYLKYDSDMYAFITQDGASIGVLPLFFYVDIDGPNKGPNTPGKDGFAFMYNSETAYTVAPYGSIDFNSTLLTSGCFKKQDLNCTAWVVNMGNMDYLKCADKLNANNTSCK